MAGGHMKYRTLSRKSSHRQALLRNLVDSLFEHESISTTWPKAKEAQRLAEKLVTLGKKNSEASRRRAHQIFYRPHLLVPKLFGELRERYQERPGGYTRVLRIEPLKEDQAPSAILELVDGPKDTRFATTALAIMRQRDEELPMTDLTAQNISKVTRYRKDGDQQLENLIDEFTDLGLGEADEEREEPQKRKVYPDQKTGFTPKNAWRQYTDPEERRKKAEKKRRARLEQEESEEPNPDSESRRKGWHGGMWRR
ncbi:ribosomal protein L17 [Rhizodiscina lignyota]|uniref:Large ribosomal subunit protein bL17m n=1 Tax=Rhizodiscina lignyota TaxID=1504668 RepID=A0A9P4IH41_9PEZI|nr:ribosomal protein L17 [Rhizodiscina lignyota]